MLYLDNDGIQRPRKAWDYHHAIPRCKARGHEKDFINLEGLVLPMFKIWHNAGKLALHSNVPLGPMPTKPLRHIIRQNLADSAGENVYDRFIDVSSQLHDIADVSLNPGIKKEARRIAGNFRLQTPYILSGMVTFQED